MIVLEHMRLPLHYPKQQEVAWQLRLEDMPRALRAVTGNVRRVGAV